MSNWECKNHGHPDIKPSPSRRAIFIGRYQPYHAGHISLVRQKLDNGVPCLIMVRDIPPDPKKPLHHGTDRRNDKKISREQGR